MRREGPGRRALRGRKRRHLGRDASSSRSPFLKIQFKPLSFPSRPAPPTPACSKRLDLAGSTRGLAVSLDWIGRSRVIAGPLEPDPPSAGAEELMPAGPRITPNLQNSTCLDTGSRSSRNHPAATEGLSKCHPCLGEGGPQPRLTSSGYLVH